VASWDDVRRVVLSLPGTSERESRDGQLEWRVADKGFVWERPLRRSDLAGLGETAPDGPILAARTADVGVKAALVADQPEVYFTTPHFDGYAAVLVRLGAIPAQDLEELVTEAWMCRAPSKLVRELGAVPRRSAPPSPDR
jgi:hypothetical protein